MVKRSQDKESIKTSVYYALETSDKPLRLAEIAKRADRIISGINPDDVQKVPSQFISRSYIRSALAQLTYQGLAVKHLESGEHVSFATWELKKLTLGV